MGIYKEGLKISCCGEEITEVEAGVNGSDFINVKNVEKLIM